MKFNAVKIKEHRLVLAVSTQLVGAGTVRFACISFGSVCFEQHFVVALGFVQPSDLFHPLCYAVLILLLISQYDECLVPLTWWLMTGRCRLNSHGNLNSI